MNKILILVVDEEASVVVEGVAVEEQEVDLALEEEELVVEVEDEEVPEVAVVVHEVELK
jgi:hypothetical protein